MLFHTFDFRKSVPGFMTDPRYYHPSTLLISSSINSNKSDYFRAFPFILFILGIYCFLSRTYFQFIPVNHLCFRIYCAPLAPNLFFGFIFNNLNIFIIYFANQILKLLRSLLR